MVELLISSILLLAVGILAIIYVAFFLADSKCSKQYIIKMIGYFFIIILLMLSSFFQFKVIKDYNLVKKNECQTISSEIIYDIKE